MAQEYLKLKKSNCKNCYKCIRNCPVKAIKYMDGQAYIIESDCILCGKCFVSCPQDAKQIRYDLAQVKKLIKDGKKVAVSLAPSFLANYEGYNFASLEKALLELGFYKVEETAVGATVVKNKYDVMVNEGTHDIIISSCCASVNLLIQKYYPKALKYLAPILTPMQTHCKMLKEADPECYTVFIGPCISKKYEGDNSNGLVDHVLTFDELSVWFEDESIELVHVEDTIKGGKARIFPTTGGVLKTMKCENKGYHYLAIDGVDNCISALEEIVSGNLHNCFIEMSACQYSCSAGPCNTKKKSNPLYDLVKLNNYSPKEDFEVKNTYDISTNYKSLEKTRIMPSEEKIREILRSIGKKNKEDELNCGSCGYPTCREKAIAVYQGKADVNMCIPYLKEKAESFTDTIIDHTPNGVLVMNENLEVQLINSSAIRMLNVDPNMNVIGKQVMQLIDPYLYVKSLTEDINIIDYRAYYEKQDKYIKQSVIHDREFNLLIAIMKDVTDEERTLLRKEKQDKQTIETANKVIEKQMRIVQEIASLLGETTAETKIALTKLKESLNNEE